MLFFSIDNFYFLCIFITCDEQKTHYEDKVWFILKDATQICSLFHVHTPRMQMLKPRPMNLYIKVNNLVHQDLQKLF